MEEKEVKKQTETIGILGFIFAFIIPLVGIILSIIGISRANQNNSAKGLPIAGLVISIVRIVLRVLLIFLFVNFAVLGLSSIGSLGEEIDNRWDGFCREAKKCTKNDDGFYSCEYKNGFFDMTIPCSEEQINGESSSVVDETFYSEEVVESD